MRLLPRLAPAALLVLASCVYDGPPEVTLVPPPGGRFVTGDALELRFSEPIDAETLSINIWPARRDGEGNLEEGLTPKLGECTVAKSPCGGTTSFFTSEDRLSATIRLAPDGLGKPDVPLILEVLAGLADEDGVETGKSTFFDVQFGRSRTVNAEPVDFDHGVYIIVGEITEPLPAVITLITDVKVLPDGRASIAGAEGDETNGDAKNTRNPENLIVDTSDEGFAVFAAGYVTLDGEERFLETDPVELELKLGPIVAAIHDVRLYAKIVKNEETGVDRLDGTLSFSGLTLNPGPDAFDYPAGNTAFSADRAPDELVPAGAPRLCGELCGSVTAQCNPPEDFPTPDFCG